MFSAQPAPARDLTDSPDPYGYTLIEMKQFSETITLNLCSKTYPKTSCHWASLWMVDKKAAELSFNLPCNASAICILLRLCAENCPILSQYWLTCAEVSTKSARGESGNGRNIWLISSSVNGGSPFTARCWFWKDKRVKKCVSTRKRTVIFSVQILPIVSHHPTPISRLAEKQRIIRSSTSHKIFKKGCWTKCWPCHGRCPHFWPWRHDIQHNNIERWVKSTPTKGYIITPS